MMDPEAQSIRQDGGGGGGGGVCKSLGNSCYSCFFTTSEGKAASYVRFFNFVNATALFLTGLFSLINITNILTLSISFYFMSFYIMIFGLLLCCFEMRWSWAERRVRDSFGFLYTYMGRTVFLLFLASFCFGLMSTQQALGMAIGILTAINALFNLVIMYRHGKMFEDPSNEYGTADQAATTYLRNNPDLAQRGIAAGVNLARDNPELARQGMQAGAQYAREHPQDAQALASGAYRSSVY
jgi:hypothetical protein